MNLYFEPYTKDGCISNCNTNPKFNQIISCGSILHPIDALIVGEPEKAKCVLNILKDKKDCLSSCDIIKNHFPPASQEQINKLKDQYTQKLGSVILQPKDQLIQKIDLSVIPQPTNILEWKQNNFNDNEIKKWNFMDIPLDRAITCKKYDISPEQVLNLVLNNEIRHQDVYLTGAWLHSNRPNWGYAVKWKVKRWGWHVHDTKLHEYSQGFQCDKNNGIQSEEHDMTCPEDIQQNAKKYFADHLKIPIENIVNIKFPESGRGEGNISPIGHRWRFVWEKYKFVIAYIVPKSDYSMSTFETLPKKEILPSGYCVKCKKEAFKHIWKSGENITLYFGLCENCYTIFAKKSSYLPCEKCNEVESYHLWKDGWTGQCFDGLCESCTIGISKPTKIIGTVEEQIDIVKSKIKFAKAHYRMVYQKYQDHLILNSGETPPIYDTRRFNNLHWYPEHNKLWEIQSNASQEIKKLEKILEELLKNPIELGRKLVTACTKGNLQEVQSLVKNGADINFPHFSGIDYGITPLISASQHGNYDIVEFLLDSGANIDQSYNQLTPLMMVVASKEGIYENRCKVLKLLLQKGADIGQTDVNGWTASMYAKKTGNKNMLKIIEENYVWGRNDKKN
jgi:hypothetical protein